MVNQTINNTGQIRHWWNPFQWGGGYSSNIYSKKTSTGDSNIGSGLVNLTKKEQSILNLTSTQQTSQIDRSITTSNQYTDQYTMTYTNAPTIVLNSAGSTVGGATTTQTPTTSNVPTIQTKKEQKSSSATDMTGGQTRGLDFQKIILYGAIGSAIYLIISMTAPATKKVVSKLPAVATAKKVLKTVKKVRKKATKKKTKKVSKK